MRLVVPVSQCNPSFNVYIEKKISDDDAFYLHRKSDIKTMTIQKGTKNKSWPEFLGDSEVSTNVHNFSFS